MEGLSAAAPRRAAGRRAVQPLPRDTPLHWLSVDSNRHELSRWLRYVLAMGRHAWTFHTDAPIDTARYEPCNAPLKFCVLELVGARGGVTYRELADALDTTGAVASGRLGRYAKKGLLSQSRAGGGGPSVFRLTKRGRDRLEHFRDVAAPDETPNPWAG